MTLMARKAASGRLKDSMRGTRAIDLLALAKSMDLCGVAYSEKHRKTSENIVKHLKTS